MQSVAFVRALATAHRYLLLDEPLSALHEGIGKEPWFLLRDLQQKYRFTMMMVTHSLEEAFFLGDQLSVIIDGAIQRRNILIYRLPDGDIERFIDEDVPYGDLTTSLAGIGNIPGEIVFSTRDQTTLCCTEEAGRVLEKSGATVTANSPSGTDLSPGTDFLRAEGPAQALHAGWKVALNLLEYASGITTRTHGIVAKAKSINPDIVLVATRKSFPGTKKIAIKAVTAGGAFPHRLGLSETILIFKQHTAFLGGLEVFLQTVGRLSTQAPEKKIMVEAETAEEALRIAQSAVDIVQIDKMSPRELSLLIRQIKNIAPAVKVSAAGGINEANVAEYAATGADIIVLSSVYFGKPADIAVRLSPKK